MANRNIFRAIHERKWLSIEYKNGKEEITKYWIGIIDINPVKKNDEGHGTSSETLHNYRVIHLYRIHLVIRSH